MSITMLILIPFDAQLSFIHTDLSLRFLVLLRRQSASLTPVE